MKIYILEHVAKYLQNDTPSLHSAHYFTSLTMAKEKQAKMIEEQYDFIEFDEEWEEHASRWVRIREAELIVDLEPKNISPKKVSLDYLEKMNAAELYSKQEFYNQIVPDYKKEFKNYLDEVKSMGNGQYSATAYYGPGVYEPKLTVEQELRDFLRGDVWHDEEGWQRIWEDQFQTKTPVVWFNTMGVRVAREQKEWASHQPAILAGMRRRWTVVCRYIGMEVSEAGKLFDEQ